MAAREKRRTVIEPPSPHAYRQHDATTSPQRLQAVPDPRSAKTREASDPQCGSTARSAREQPRAPAAAGSPLPAHAEPRLAVQHRLTVAARCDGARPPPGRWSRSHGASEKMNSLQRAQRILPAATRGAQRFRSARCVTPYRALSQPFNYSSLNRPRATNPDPDRDVTEAGDLRQQRTNGVPRPFPL